MALLFVPPTAPLVPMVSLVRPNPADDLFKYYRPMDAGINIWIVGGVVTTTEPDYEFVTPDATFLGSHIHEVTASEAALLTAAGYTVVEGPSPVTYPTPLPGGDWTAPPPSSPGSPVNFTDDFESSDFE